MTFVPTGLSIAVLGFGLTLITLGIDEINNPRVQKDGLWKAIGGDLQRGITLIHSVGEKMLRIENVTISYLGSERPAVSNVLLDIDSGEIFALVGESGSGKSTLLQSILRILPSPGVINRGSLF